MTLQTKTPFGVEAGTVPSSTLTLAQLNSLARNPGRYAIGGLRVASNVAEQETVTIGADVYEIEIVNTDSTGDAAGGDFANTTNPLVLPTAGTDYANVTWAAGRLIRLENEIMLVYSVSGNRVRLVRGVSGTTVASHANGADIYQGDGVTAGRMAVGLVATLTPAVFTAALAADINARGTEAVTAYKISDNEVLFVTEAVGAVTTAIAETLNGTNNAVDTAALRLGAAAVPVNLVHVTRVPIAQEVALGTLHIACPFVPVTVISRVIVMATGAEKAWDGGVVIDADKRLVTLNNAGATDWATTDTIHLLIAG